MAASNNDGGDGAIAGKEGANGGMGKDRDVGSNDGVNSDGGGFIKVVCTDGFAVSDVVCTDGIVDVVCTDGFAASDVVCTSDFAVAVVVMDDVVNGLVRKGVHLLMT